MFMILACVSASYLQVIVVTDRSQTKPPQLADGEGLATEPYYGDEYGTNTPTVPAYPPQQEYYSTPYPSP